MYSQLNPLERDVLEMLLAGSHPSLKTLRLQLQRADIQREMTGVGFYLQFALPDATPRIRPESCRFGDVHAELAGLKYGVGFLLFIDNGQLSQLEAYTYDERWPETLGAYALRYSKQERSLPFI